MCRGSRQKEKKDIHHGALDDVVMAGASSSTFDSNTGIWTGTQITGIHWHSQCTGLVPYVETT
jgi:hypothetical protein